MTARWTTPADVVAKLRRAWDRGEILAARLGGAPVFPLTVRLSRPDSRAVDEQFAAAQDWTLELERGSRAVRGIGYEIEWEEVNQRRTGRNRIPRRVVVPTEADALALLGLSAEGALWTELAETTLERFPSMRAWIQKAPLRLLEHGREWDKLLGIVDWFVRNPRSGRYLRQIDAEGVDSKFIESRRGILGELLDLALPPDQIDQNAVGARAFEQRYGLRARPVRLRIRSLDDGLRFGGLSDVEAPASEWARTPLSIDRLILVENEVNFLAFPPLERSAVAFGGGYAVDRWAEVPWLHDLPIFYWGDIDTHGFGILDQLRSVSPHVRSFLMDEGTLLDHRRMWVTEEEPLGVALERLTADESELYEALRREQFGPATRLEQERIGFPFLERAVDWIRRTSTLPFRRSTARGFVFEAEDGGFQERPETWIDPRAVRNWVIGDPLLDWLVLHGAGAGFQRDDELPGYDPRTDLRLFLEEKAVAFHQAVLDLLTERAAVMRISPRAELGAWTSETREALCAGSPIVAGGLLDDPLRGARCLADLLVRSDLLSSWFPGAQPASEVTVGAPALGHADFHYVPVLVRFRAFDITADGHVSTGSEQLVHAVEGWFHAQALGALQGSRVSHAFLVGRNWRQGEARGTGTLERLARVDVDRWLPQRDCTLGDVARSAAAWLRRLRREGHEWQVLPRPSVPELYPHARNPDDAPWHTAKRRLAEELEELTLLPGMNPDRRRAAHQEGLFRWGEEGVSATSLGVTTPVASAQMEAVLEANRSPSPSVVPKRFSSLPDGWRHPSRVEFFVDFETVTHLEDDLADLPLQGGASQIVQIGCGHVDETGDWRFAQWTVDALTLPEERRILDAWMGHMAEVSRAAGSSLRSARVCHWSAAERVQLETAYDNARRRHPESDWPAVPWFDLLQDLVRAVPIGVTGAFGFGLKAVAKAMQAGGFIETTWPPGPTDGLGAMVGTWRAARETTELSKHPLMLEIARYNEVDCRAMLEILTWLRRHR